MSVRTLVAHDELHRHGESLVLHDGQVQRVSAIGTLIRERASGTVTLEELAVALEAAFGAPPEGTALELTRQAVETLLATGLLEEVAD